jgi:hypothetical protein
MNESNQENVPAAVPGQDASGSTSDDVSPRPPVEYVPEFSPPATPSVIETPPISPQPPFGDRSFSEQRPFVLAQPTPVAKRRRVLPAIPTIIIGVGAALAFCLVGIGVGATGKTTATLSAPIPSAAVGTVVVTVTAAAPSPIVSTVTITAPPPAAATPPAVAPPPAGSKIEEGTWTVGTDFSAGTYRTAGASSDCYWAITKSGSNGADIVQNHFGGGNLTVTLKSGQDFSTERCGSWVKIG